MDLLMIAGMVLVVLFIFTYPEKWDRWLDSKLDKLAGARRQSESNSEKSEDGVIDIEKMRRGFEKML